MHSGKFQYSLRTMLLAIAGASVVMGVSAWGYRAYRAKQELFDALRSIGCTFSPDSEQITNLEARPLDRSFEEAFASLAPRLSSVEHVELSTGSADGYMATLTSFPRLRFLRVERATIGRDGWAKLAQSTSLQKIEIRDCAFNPNEMVAVGAAPKLRMVYVVTTQIRPTGSLGALAGMKGVEDLTCISDFLRDSDVRFFVNASSLRRLKLVGIYITPETIAAVKQALPNCEVSITNTHDMTD
jgi:hypothetical protein